jgi:anti-sigma factor RsiW
MPNTTCKARDMQRSHRLITYAFGECSDEEQTRFEAHLTHCVICATELESIALIQGAIDHRELDIA